MGTRGHNKNWSQCKMREGNSLLYKPSLKVSNNLFYRPLTVKRDKVRENTPSLTTWSPLQSLAAWGPNAKWERVIRCLTSPPSKAATLWENHLIHHRVNMTENSQTFVSDLWPLLTDDEGILFRSLFSVYASVRRGGVSPPLPVVRRDYW